MFQRVPDEYSLLPDYVVRQGFIDFQEQNTKRHSEPEYSTPPRQFSVETFPRTTPMCLGTLTGAIASFTCDFNNC